MSTMAEASLLSLKPKFKDINKYRELDEEWYSLGIELEFDDKELDELEEKYKDPHRRVIKMFGAWLEQGENPTYRKLIKALVDIDKKDIAQSVSKSLGLTSSLDSLLGAMSPAKLSECSPISAKDTQAPVGHQSPQNTTASEHSNLIPATETDAKAPVNDQPTIATEIKSPTASCTPILLSNSSYKERMQEDFSHTSDTDDHSEAKSEISLADSMSISHSFNVQTKSSSDMHNQTLLRLDSSHQKHFTKVQTVVMSGQTAAMDMPTLASTVNDPYQIMLRYNDKLISALSLDPQSIAGTLLAKGLIPENTEAQMRQDSTPYVKATILVSTVREVIKISPKQFHVFLDILSRQAWMKDIMEELKSLVGQEHLKKDACIQAASTEDHISIDNNEHHSGNDISSNGEDYQFPKLNSEDKAELEAQLILSADSMRKKFASLLLSVVNSFQSQGIDPRKLATAILALTEYDDPVIGKPLLDRDKDALMKAQTVDHTFDVLRPHMTFFNYEILEFLIEEMGTSDDKHKLQKFLHEFKRFCRRSVFEIPPNVLGHSAEKVVGQQKFCVKVTKQFKVALLAQQLEPDLQNTSSTQLSSSHEDMEGICAPKLGISLEDAKHIQRKLASVLKLKVSSIYLDSATSGSTILTFLLPLHISLTGLDSDPEVIVLLSNGIHILCGPPGKPEPKELTSNGLVVHWSQPEYGRPSLAKYLLHYQKKCSEAKPPNEWQKLELRSLDTHTCVPDLTDGDTYVFKICTVSDIGTLQYSNESDPIVISGDEILTNDIYKVIVANKATLISAFSSLDPNKIAVMLSIKGIISNKDAVQIGLASTPSEKVTLLVTVLEHQMKDAPKKFPDFLNVLSEAKLSLSGNVVQTLWSDYYDSVYRQYLGYLKFLYASLDKKQTSNQWLPSAIKKFFRLAMIKTTMVQRGNDEGKVVQVTITEKVDNIQQEKYPIELKDIFNETGDHRKVIMLEGASGCGKSTLSVYICQQWEKGQLFNQFKFIILIRLRDPTIKNAKDLADLLPCPDTTTAQQIAARMLASNCRDTLFILDGWDELQFKLQENSIFHQLVQPESPQSKVCESTVIVTSRPIASGDLHQVISSHVEILGFAAEELHQFFTEYLKGDTEAVKTLLKIIEENPDVADSCYLPLNATILVHLFKQDSNILLTTLCGIFSSLVLNCIKLHLKLHTQYKDVSIESLEQLPEFVKKPFSVLCLLAYNGIMGDKVIFNSLPPDFNTLSLLQGVESFIGREKAVSYNFIHLSIRELLAAWYVATQIPANEQVSKINELFNKSNFTTVFRFYATITKLNMPGIKEVVKSVVKKYKSKLQQHFTQEEGRILMISLLHCLYEAQNPSLCEFVAQQLQHRLNVLGTTLTPSDCLCIGYFLAHACKKAAGEFKVNLSGCSIGDQGCKYLVSGLCKYLNTHSVVTTTLRMFMRRNAISHHGVHHLSALLKIGCIEYLDLTRNIASHCDTKYPPFSTFAEKLKNNITLRMLYIQECGLNSRSAKRLAEALTTNKHLEELDISNNALCDDGIQHLAHALSANQGLKILWLNSCGMTDMGFEGLAKSLEYNTCTVLNQVLLWNFSSSSHKPNKITEKMIPVLTECLQSNYTLAKLVLPKNLQSSTTSIEKAVNDARMSSGQPLNIKVEAF